MNANSRALTWDGNRTTCRRYAVSEEVEGWVGWAFNPVAAAARPEELCTFDASDYSDDLATREAAVAWCEAEAARG